MCRGLILLAGLGAVLTALSPARAMAGGDDPLTRPIAPELAPRWLETGGAVRVHGSTWLMGLTHMNVVLIATDAGLILIDAGLPQAAPLIEQGIRAAGYRVTDIKLILSSEPHYDHAGGIAALARDSGARVLASAAGATVLRAGMSGAEDPQRAALFPYPPVPRVTTVHDGEHIRLGDMQVVAHATPGHTPGSMSWSWMSCTQGGVQDCAAIVFAASLNSRTEGDYRYSSRDHAAVRRQFRRSFATIRALPCDIVITGHPEHSDGEARMAQLRNDPGGDGYRSPGACHSLADRYEAAFDARLAEEAAAVLPAGGR
ncbi:MAG: subclass B3 metallo-beta-lactamase [Sphingobium sp.]